VKVRGVGVGNIERTNYWACCQRTGERGGECSAEEGGYGVRSRFLPRPRPGLGISLGNGSTFQRRIRGDEMMLSGCYWQAVCWPWPQPQPQRSSEFRRGWPGWAVAVAVAGGHEGVKAGLDGDKWGSEWNASGSGSGLPEKAGQSRAGQSRSRRAGHRRCSSEEPCKARKLRKGP
jgi:hypothetical protein